MNETNEGYAILKAETYRVAADGKEDRTVLGYRGGKFPMWVTWESLKIGDDISYFWGHYTPHESEAYADYHERLRKHYERRPD